MRYARPAGQRVVAALLDAKREAIIAGQGYVEALRAYWRARTELELLLAGHLRESM